MPKAVRALSRVRHLPLTQARNNLGAVVNSVHLRRDYVILEKDGIPLAGLMDIDEFEDYLELQDPRARADILKSNAEYLAGMSRPYKEFLADLRREEQKKVRRRRNA